MTYKTTFNCLLYSFILGFMLLLQTAHGQNPWNHTETWLQKNLKDLGGNAVFIVMKEGKILFNKNFNDVGPIKRRMAEKRGMSTDWNENTPALIASASKWLSAALVMTFVDESKLRLSDTVGKFLPVFTSHGKGDITIAECLSHLTGTGSRMEENRAYGKMSSMEECMLYIANKRQVATHGTSFHYGSDGLQIASAVLEKISGKRFEQLFQERIARPLGMSQTTFGLKPVALPAGGARSTAADYLKFLVMILNRGKANDRQVLSENAVKEMQLNRIDGKQISYTPDQAGNWGYGFGEWVLNEFTVSSPGLFGTFPWVNNKEKYAAILFTFNLKNKGRQERYRELLKMVDEAVRKS